MNVITLPGRFSLLTIRNNNIITKIGNLNIFETIASLLLQCNAYILFKACISLKFNINIISHNVFVIDICLTVVIVPTYVRKTNRGSYSEESMKKRLNGLEKEILLSGNQVCSLCHHRPAGLCRRRLRFSSAYYLFNVFHIRHVGRKIAQCSPNKDGGRRFKYTA